MIDLRCFLASALLASGFGLVGCAAGPSPSSVDIQSPEANQRIEAIVAMTNRAQAGEGRETLIPLLVDRLDDEDDGVRMYAIVGLDRLTGQRLGYRYEDPPDARGRAVERWREYIQRSASAAGPAEAAPAGNER